MSEWLAHHGILGQKWGVRRYQNPDGTLTEEGKARYNEADEIHNNVWKRKDIKDEDERITEGLKSAYTKLRANRDYQRTLEAAKKADKQRSFLFGAKKIAKAHVDFQETYERLQEELGINKLNKDQAALFKKVMSITVKQMGLEDTEEARHYVYTLLNSSGD